MCRCWACGLQVSPKVLEKSLIQSSFQTNREKVTKPLTAEQALDGRDAFVKVTHANHHTVLLWDWDYCLHL